MSQQTVNEAVPPSLIRINHIFLYIYEDDAAEGEAVVWAQAARS